MCGAAWLAWGPSGPPRSEKCPNISGSTLLSQAAVTAHARRPLVVGWCHSGLHFNLMLSQKLPDWFNSVACGSCGFSKLCVQQGGVCPCVAFVPYLYVAKMAYTKMVYCITKLSRGT